MTSLSILFLGLLLGMKHATEADHLAAMATLVTHEKSLARTMKVGVAWGIGHTLTLMLFGGIVLALGKAISQRLEQALELAVGLMLIGFGLDVLRRLLRQRIHFHVHGHETGMAHMHAHSHAGEDAHRFRCTAIPMPMPKARCCAGGRRGLHTARRLLLHQSSAALPTCGDCRCAPSRWG